MKIKITQKTGDYMAGLVYDVPDKEAQKLINKDIAFLFQGETVEITAVTDKMPIFLDIDKPNKKAAK
jgi:hypothetical protein